MKTFERWVIANPDGDLINITFRYNNISAWDALHNHHTGECAAHNEHVAHYEYLGYQAVRVTVTVEGGE